MPLPINSHRKKKSRLPKQLFNQGRTEGKIMIGAVIIAVVLLIVLI